MKSTTCSIAGKNQPNEHKHRLILQLLLIIVHRRLFAFTEEQLSEKPYVPKQQQQQQQELKRCHSGTYLIMKYVKKAVKNILVWFSIENVSESRFL